MFPTITCLNQTCHIVPFWENKETITQRKCKWYATFMKHWWFVITLSLLVVISVGTLYAQGYRIGPNISLVKTRTLTITDLPKGASIFVDYTPRGKSNGDTAHIELVPGNHTLLVSAQNYSPWTKIFTMSEDTNSTVRALMVPKALSGTLLSGSAAQKARKIIAKAILPSNKKPLLLAGGCALVSVLDNKIIATPTTTPTCAPPPYFCVNNSCAKTIILSPSHKILSLVAYPNRGDALIALIGKNIYAFSLDPRAPRTFVSILHGISPRMAIRSDGVVVVEDQSSVYTLSLPI